jgi:hypothetical protein
MMRPLLIAFAALIVVAMFVPTTNAQVCGGYGYDYGALYNSLDYRVPYFAAHPPVYYSYPVPRPYGFSPFAYPPNVRTPEILGAAEPVIIDNPYVPSSQTKEVEGGDQLTSQRKIEPLVIHNPYFTADRQLASSER